jgi:hypothetical protein
MAVSLWSVGYPIDFSAYGDRTFEAIRKECIDEIKKLYEHLNYLRYNTTNFANIAISGVGALPATGTPSQIWAQPGNPPKLFAWTGTEWRELELTFPSPATTVKPGTLQVGSIADALSVNPSHERVITEKQLSEYSRLGSAGVLTGAIAIWHGTASTIPDGWVYCDGQNGTPDLRGVFIRGASVLGPAPRYDGADTVSVPDSTLPVHTHELTVAHEADGHTHHVKFDSALANNNHQHDILPLQVTVSGGAHQHPAPADYFIYSSGGLVYLLNWENEGYVTSSFGGGVVLQPSGAHTHAATGRIQVLENADGDHAHTFDGATWENDEQVIELSGTSAATHISAPQDIDIKPAYKEVVFMMKLEVPIYG